MVHSNTVPNKRQMKWMNVININGRTKMSDRTEWWEHMLSLVEQQNKELKEWIAQIENQDLDAK